MQPTGPLGDFSYAGYAANSRLIPLPDVVSNVKDFGAAGDGERDDTSSFKKAIAKASQDKGAVFIPPGKYIITEKLIIDSSSVVLRGAGVEKTELFFPKPLGEIYGDVKANAGSSLYAFREGFIEIQGSNDKQLLATVTQPAARGSKRLYVDSTRYFKEGNWVKLWMSDPPQGSGYTGSLFDYLYHGIESDITDLKGRADVVRFSSRVKKVGEGWVELERPLAHEVRMEWRPEVHALTNSVQNVGIEDFTMHFKHGEYALPHY